jgi:uncharacterized phiE125 gp8 family phage protein
MRLQELTPPAEEPLTLSEAKLYLRISHDADDDALIRAAREMCENWTGLALVSHTYAFTADGWDGKPLEPPRPPLVSVEEIAVFNANGEEEIYDADFYYVETAGRPGAGHSEGHCNAAAAGPCHRGHRISLYGRIRSRRRRAR